MLHIIHGKDTFRSHLALRDLVAQQSATTIYEASDITPNDLYNFIQNESLFVDEKTLVVKNAFAEQTLMHAVIQLSLIHI